MVQVQQDLSALDRTCSSFRTQQNISRFSRDTHFSPSILPLMSNVLKALMTTSSSSEPTTRKTFYLGFCGLRAQRRQRSWTRTSGHPGGEEGQQLGEVDGSRGLSDHLLKLLVGGKTAQAVEGGTQIVLADNAILVLVHQLEGLQRKSGL